jgi:hypothetical protein
MEGSYPPLILRQIHIAGLPSGSKKTGRSSGYTNGLLISAMSTVGIALLVAVITLAGFFIYKKRCSNLHQVDQASNIDGLSSFHELSLLICLASAISLGVYLGVKFFVDKASDSNGMSWN